MEATSASNPPDTGGSSAAPSPRALTIAGSDSGGGAGIQADLKTFTAYGVYGASAITALTAQNTVGVQAVHVPPPELVAAQIRSVCGDIGVDAAKTGMLGEAAIVEAVAATLVEVEIPWLVVDPVMVAKSGDRLLADDAVAALRERLLPLADCVTPNLPEARVLTGLAVGDLAGMEAAARELCEAGARAAVVKGGHLEDARLVDVLCLAGGRLVHLEAARQETRHSHGTGCTFSAAIAAGLALGWDLEAAVRSAHGYVQRALRAAPGLGAGHGPLEHRVEPPEEPV